MHATLSLSVTLVLGACAGHALGQGASASRSFGQPSAGRLAGGVELKPGPHLRRQRSRRAAYWGTAELVAMVRRAAAEMHHGRDTPRLLVGSLSLSEGGVFSPHSSHQNGRDVDLGLYLTTWEGQPVEAPRFVEMSLDGCGVDRGVRYCLDGERTFELLATLLEDPVARIQWVLIAPDLRARILEAGRRAGVDPPLVERVALITELHGGSRAHRGHLHVRIYCPVDDRPDCVDTPPYHAWYEAAPGGDSVTPSSARHRRAARARARRRAQRRRAAARRRRAVARRARATKRTRQAARRRRAQRSAQRRNRRRASKRRSARRRASQSRGSRGRASQSRSKKSRR